jgi:hypothetical protein
MSFDPITAVLDVAGKLIDKFFPDPNQAAAAKLEMFKAQQAGEFKQLDQDFQLAIEQIKTNAVEAANPSVFVSGGRPAAMWVCVGGLFYTFLAQPLLAWGAAIFKLPIPPVIDSGMLIQLLVGMLGLAGWRSLDKSNGVASK